MSRRQRGSEYGTKGTAITKKAQRQTWSAENSWLPRYSVLVALYREANAVPALCDALAQLEYADDRLEILLLVEPDDPETIDACRHHLRPGWRVIEVPRGAHRTKRRALNFGLKHTTGRFFTIYDAADRPEPDQLIKAVKRRWLDLDQSLAPFDQEARLHGR